MTGFGSGVLDEMRSARTVAIRTSRRPTGPVREAVVWIVVDERERVLVRSVRGDRGRWYRDLLAHPSATLILNRQQVAVRAEIAGDPERVESCSRALRAKYSSARGSLASMLRPEMVASTLELHPA